MNHDSLLKRARERLNMSLEALSKATGINVTTLNEIEARRRILTPLEANKISPILEVLAEELLDDTVGSFEGDRKMKKVDQTTILTIATHKGGSGKTTISQNLAYTMSVNGYNVLLIDTDSQTNLSRSFELKDAPEDFYTCFVNRKSILEAIISTEYEHLDIVKSSIKLSTIELLMAQMPYREKRMLEVLKPVIECKKYHFIIIDTNPSLGLLNTSIFNATDYILLPVEPSSYGVDGLEIFTNHLEMIQAYHDVKLLGIVLNKVNERTLITKEVRNVIESLGVGRLFNSFIRQDNDIKNAQWNNMPVSVYNKRSRAAQDFTDLMSEVIKNV